MFDDASVEAIWSPFKLGRFRRMTVPSLWQSLTSLMQKARRVFCSMHHLEFPNVESIHVRQVSAAAFFHAGQQISEIVFSHAFAQKKPSKHCSGRTTIDFRQHVDQELGLRAVMRGVAIDLEEVREAVDQVVDRRSVVGSFIA